LCLLVCAGTAAAQRHGGHENAPAARVRSANSAALREPSRSGYVNALQVYPYSEGTLYRVYAAPEQVTDIALQAGEAVTSVASGDTVRWIVGDTTSGSGVARRAHILVKPSAAGLRTNLVITTDRRVYHLELESTAATAMAALSWSYPEDALIALHGVPAASEPGAPAAAGPALENLGFDYRISGDSPPWRPLRVFDDGRQTFIEFPASIAQGSAPPLFVIGDGGEAELVNYRMAGRFYVVDRLFARAELRLGAGRQKIVRISRDDGAHGRHGRRSS
jgi:type IV secretion system protein VirB9